MPLEIKAQPRNAVDSQFSIPWAVATALSKGKPTINDFSESAIHNNIILQLTQKMIVVLDHSLEKPHKIEAGKIEITMLNGEVYSERIENALGSSENPLSFLQCK